MPRTRIDDNDPRVLTAPGERADRRAGVPDDQGISNRPDDDEEDDFDDDDEEDDDEEADDADELTEPD